MRSLSKWFKKYFIPHGENDYRPHFLRRESVLFVFFVIIVIELGFLVQVFIVFDKTNFLASVLPSVLTNITNQERAENDAPPLVQNDLLTKAAQLKAEDMATHGYFAHTSPEGKTPWYWFDQVGYHYAMAGENLAVNFFESGDVAQAWMNSPTHRSNIVKKDYTEIGIGVASGIYEGKNTVFVAQLFGTPIIVPAQAETESPTTPFAVPKKEVAKAPVSKPTPKTNTQIKQTPVPVVTSPALATEAPIATKVLGDELTPTKNDTIFSTMRSFVQKVLTSPREYATYLYAGIALLIILVLLLIILIESEIKHPILIARGVSLVAIIIFLFILNMRVLNLKTNIVTTDLTASAIEAAN